MSLTRQSLRCCSRSSSLPCRVGSIPSRSISTSLPRRNESNETPSVQEEPSTPRWMQTPPRMKAPFSINIPKDPKRTIWKVNEDPEKLDRFYERLLGRDLARNLPDELKWLAVTHKSFDNGRRGFNTRLAFYGRQIFALEATRSIMVSPSSQTQNNPDPHGREPFDHPALQLVDKLGQQQPQDIFSVPKMTKIASELGLPEVMRWKPRLPENLEGSGIGVVVTSTMFAIVGAVSLQHGADVAGKIVRERILRRLD